jgi:hypothetical protein
MSQPSDKALYEKVKKQIYKKYPNHSAYRSGLLVKEYKKQHSKKHPDKQPYLNKSTNGLKRWFKEKWRNQRGEVGYKKKGDVYRPTVRVSNKTPTTFKELSKSRIKKAMKKKKTKGRVDKF